MIAALLLGCASCARAPAPAVPIEAACSATDGDTIRCGAEKIRLLGIDSPEMPGHCRQGRECAPGDPFAARANMAALVEGKALTIRRAGFDRYGRTLAIVIASGTDVSCAQLAGGFAVYKPRWDNGRAVAQDCPSLGG